MGSQQSTIRVVVVATLIVFCTIDASTTVCQNSHEAATTAVDVVIVGAGIAGLSAYQELNAQQPSLNIVILEANDNVGGHMRSASIAGYTIEQGPNWLTEKGTSFWQLAKKSEIMTSESVYDDMVVYNDKGETISNKFENRKIRMQQKSVSLRNAGPFRSMLEAAQQYWYNTSDEYDGSENIMGIMANYGYIEHDELDAFVRWFLIDYDYCHWNIALWNFDGVGYISRPFYSEPFVVDERGFSTILTNFIKENNIPNPSFGIQVTDIIYDNHESLDSTYKVLVQGTRTKTGECVKYRAKRVIVTVPPNILLGQGYSINFSPRLKIEHLPFQTGQYNKLFYKFNTRFWDNRQFVGIVRDKSYRGVCNHWQNIDYNIPGSQIMMCTLTDEGMEKVIAMNLTTSDLLEPLRKVYGHNVVDSSWQDTYFSRYDLDPSTGYGAYSSIQPGYTVEDFYKFYGGESPNGFVMGEGHNGFGEWVVHISGASSCMNFFELVDGAFYSGQRSAQYLLQSLGYPTQVNYNCEYWS